MQYFAVYVCYSIHAATHSSEMFNVNGWYVKRLVVFIETKTYDH